jgi:hypothetical protein
MPWEVTRIDINYVYNCCLERIDRLQGALPRIISKDPNKLEDREPISVAGANHNPCLRRRTMTMALIAATVLASMKKDPTPQIGSNNNIHHAIDTAKPAAAVCPAPKACAADTTPQCNALAVLDALLPCVCALENRRPCIQPAR